MTAQAQDRLEEILSSTDGRVEKLTTLTLEAEVDHNAIDALREEIKKWVTSIKADSLIHYSLHMVGAGHKHFVDAKDKMDQLGTDVEPDRKIKLNEQVEKIVEKVDQIATLSIDAERTSANAENLRNEIKKWVDTAKPETLTHFAEHMIGSGIIFSRYVRKKMEGN